MSMYVLTGELLNVLQLGGTPDPAANSNFPVAKLIDDDPGTIFRFGSITAAPSVTYSVDRLLGFGDMEAMPASGPLPTWTDISTGGGSLARSATAHAGSFGAEFTAGAGTAGMSAPPVTARSGQRMRVESWLRGDVADDGVMGLRIRNLQTGNYLTSAGAWSATPQNLAAGVTDSYVAHDLSFTVESYSVCRSDTVQLELQLINAVAGSVTYADDVILIPAVTFASVHGHNIDPSCGLTLRSSTDNFSSSDDLVATFTVKQPSFYTTFAEVFRRYWRFAFTGTQSDRSGPTFIGEWVLGEHLTLSKGPAYPMQLPHSDPQIRIAKRVGAPTTYQLSQFNQRTFPVSFRAENMTQRLEILQEVFERSRGGKPLVVVPHHTDSFTEVLYGKLAPGLPHSWETRSFVAMDTEIMEMAFPLVTSE